jgi:hypothetical protein
MLTRGHSLMNIHLPNQLHLRSFDTVFKALQRLSSTDQLDLYMNQLEFAEPAGLLPFVCVLRNHLKSGGSLTIRSFPQNLDICGYLERINFYQLARCSCPHQPGRRKNSDAFIEITEMDGNVLSQSVRAKIHSLIEGRVDLKNAVGESFVSACGELVDNTRHAYNEAITEQAADWPPALILAQYYEHSNTLHVTVADCGVGITRSLGAKDPQDASKGDRQAIDRALILGMKGVNRSGKGLGLAAIKKFMKQNGGVLGIRSGSTFYVQRSHHRRHHNVDTWKGTVVSLEINGARNTDISSIIGEMGPKVSGSKK